MAHNGTREVVINPKYEALRDFILTIPDIFESEGEVIYHDRNTIKVLTANGMRLNVKRYCIPPLLHNRYVYRFFRKPKAVRAFEYALRLQEMNIDTPEPVAYITFSHNGKLGFCYFISVQRDFAHDIEELQQCSPISDDERKMIVKLSRYTAYLHDMGICHNDYGSGNVLYNIDEGGKPLFSLLDINRMRFGEVSFERGCKNFRLLRFTPERFKIAAEAYAKARGYDPKSCFERMIKEHEAFIKRNNLKKRIKGNSNN